MAISWVIKSDMISHRVRLGVAVADNLIYATGGYYLGSILASAEVFTPNGNSWASIADMPLRRKDHAAVGYNGKVYVLGGAWSDMANMGVPVENWITRCAPVHIYDPATNSWSVGASMPTPRTQVAAAELNGEIWVIGGFTDEDPTDSVKEASSKVEIYDPVHDSWRNGPALPSVRFGMAAASLDGKIYVSGGWEDNSSDLPYFDEAYTMYASSGGGWTRLADMPYRRESHAMTSWQGKLYILAGSYIRSSDPDNATRALTNSVVEFDPGTNAYAELDFLRTKRWLHGSAQAGGTIYVLGGADSYYDSAAGDILDSVEGGELTSCSVLADVDVTVSGTGAVFSSPGINCGSDCTEKFCVGTPITLTAVAGQGASFSVWTGACSGAENSCEVTVNADLQIGAQFNAAKTITPTAMDVLLLMQ